MGSCFLCAYSAFFYGFKEMGREYFHRLSRLHPDYEFNTTDKQYNNCLNSKGSGVVFYKLKC
jgi:hypothetical protein